MERQLSTREMEILSLMMKGGINKDICARTGLTQPTVSTYKRRILDKTGMSNFIQLQGWYNDHYGLNENQTPRQRAEASFIKLFTAEDIYMLDKVSDNPGNWHRIILEKYSHHCGPTFENTKHLNNILTWICDIASTH